MFKLAVLLCCVSLAAADTKPQLREAFAKAGLKAIVSMNNDPDSESAKAAYDNADIEHDRDDPNELQMMVNLEIFKIRRERGHVAPSCISELRDAFQHRKAIEFPDSCK